MPGQGWLREKENPFFLANKSVPFDQAGIAFGATFNAPEEFLTDNIIVTENQGNFSSCTGYGTSSAVEGCFWVASGQDPSKKPEPFSPWYAYLAAQEKCGMLGRDQGATITGAVQGAMEGSCKKTAYPHPPQYTSKFLPGTKLLAQQWRIRSHVKLTSATGVLNYQKAGLGAIIIGIAWTDALANCNGVITTRDIYDSRSGHCLTIWGWDRNGRVRIHNSHGTSWGDNGHAWIDPDTLDKMIRQRYAEFIGVSDLSGAQVARPMADFTAFV